MSESTGPDESAFGAGGESSHEADVDAGFDDQEPDGTGVIGSPEGGADETVPDSHTADVDAGYDDTSESPTEERPV